MNALANVGNQVYDAASYSGNQFCRAWGRVNSGAADALMRNPNISFAAQYTGIIGSWGMYYFKKISFNSFIYFSLMGVCSPFLSTLYHSIVCRSDNRAEMKTNIEYFKFFLAKHFISPLTKDNLNKIFNTVLQIFNTTKDRMPEEKENPEIKPKV